MVAVLVAEELHCGSLTGGGAWHARPVGTCCWMSCSGVAGWPTQTTARRRCSELGEQQPHIRASHICVLTCVQQGFWAVHHSHWLMRFLGALQCAGRVMMHGVKGCCVTWCCQHRHSHSAYICSTVDSQQHVASLSAPLQVMQFNHMSCLSPRSSAFPSPQDMAAQAGMDGSRDTCLDATQKSDQRMLGCNRVCISQPTWTAETMYGARMLMLLLG